MPSTRPRVLAAAILIVASTTLVAITAVTADAAATPTAGASSDALGAPGDLHVTAITPTSVTLFWTHSTGAVTGYRVNHHRAFDDVYYAEPVGLVDTTTITSTIGPTGQYTFWVQALDAAGNYSPSSNQITVVTPAGTTGDTTPPTTPAALQVTGVSTSGVGLTWTASTDDVGVVAYDVYLFDGWYTSQLVGPAFGTSYAAPFNDSTSTGLRYYYVRARDAAGNRSIASNTVQVTSPTASPSPTLPPTTLPPTSPAPTCGVSYRTTSQRAGASLTVGLAGRWSTSNAAPTAAALNGAACAVS